MWDHSTQTLSLSDSVDLAATHDTELNFLFTIYDNIDSSIAKQKAFTIIGLYSPKCNSDPILNEALVEQTVQLT